MTSRMLDVRSMLTGMRTLRRGLDPHDVTAALTTAAEHIQTARRDRDIALAEAQRAKDALRQWQSEHAKTCQAPPAPAPRLFHGHTQRR